MRNLDSDEQNKPNVDNIGKLVRVNNIYEVFSGKFGFVVMISGFECQYYKVLLQGDAKQHLMAWGELEFI